MKKKKTVAKRTIPYHTYHTITLHTGHAMDSVHHCWYLGRHSCHLARGGGIAYPSSSSALWCGGGGDMVVVMLLIAKVSEKIKKLWEVLSK